MATMIIKNRKVSMTIEQKARLLSVFDIGEDGVLVVPSGSEKNTAYAVKHNGVVSHFCPCKAVTPRCAHRVAVDWYLEEKNRRFYCDQFDIYAA